jgi:sterol desaturase/sphingolipid hydroxylase (fatty acid hydroxylase superfamily)
MDTATILSIAYGACFSFFFFALTFAPLEKAFPAKPGQKFFRPDWWTDLCFFLGQHFLWISLVLTVLTWLSYWLDATVPSDFRAAVAAQPWWLQVVEVVVLSDFLVYWGHRLQHTNSFLWRFHAIHHTSQHLDWLAAHREHPLDSVYQLSLINLPPLLIGFPLQTIAGLIAFRGIWAIYIHSNVRIPLGPIKMLIGAPQLHHWHHDRSRDAGNYANISPLMDLIFGTYVCPDHEPAELGIREEIPKDYVGQMLYPLAPRFFKERNKSLVPVPSHEVPCAAKELSQASNEPKLAT